MPRMSLSLGAAMMVVVIVLSTSNLAAQTSVNGESVTIHSHNINPGPDSPFFAFASDANGTPYFYDPANGVAGDLISGNGDTTNVTGTLTIVGNSSALTNFSDGNRLPNGVTLSYDFSFTISTNDGLLVTAAGNTGNGLGVGAAPFGAFAPDESVEFSAATFSNISFTGSPLDPGVTFTPGTVTGIGMSQFRSANFGEGTNGAILDNGTDTIGFGLSTGSIASNVAMNNGFVTANRFPVMLMDVPITLSMDSATTGNFNLKGIEFTTFFDYEFTAPNSGLSAALANYSHNINPGPFSPFFTEAVDADNGTVYNYTPANGLEGTIVASSSDTTTVSGTVTIVGNATAADDFTSGNQLPQGITLTYDLSFNISSPDGMLTTAAGNTGNGIGVGPDQYEALNDGEQLVFSPATISNVAFSGTPVEDINFVPGDVEDVAFTNFRSNNFNEGVSGAVLSNGTDSIGFGLASGSVESGVAINNGFTAATRFPPVSLLDTLTLTAEGVDTIFNLKGFELATFFSFETDSGGLLGDVNCDGFVDLLDVGPFIDLLIGGGFNSKADINQDGVVDLLDVGPFVDILTGG